VGKTVNKIEMNGYVSKRKILVVVIGLVILCGVAFAINRNRTRSAVNARRSQMPGIVLWAWERPTDLRFIKPDQTGVAFLARTVHLRNDEVIAKPRLQPLSLPANSRVTAVVRVETDSISPPTLSTSQTARLANSISEVASLPNIVAVQIDFDATRSQREFYRKVIVEVRRHLPGAIGLSITALASWCADDNWLADLPIDEAVPMLFRMGPDKQLVKNRLAAGEDFSSALCRNSYGISTDEQVENLRPDRRVYVFNPDAWTEQSVGALTEPKR
jgi:hypothetical protein